MPNGIEKMPTSQLRTRLAVLSRSLEHYPQSDLREPLEIECDAIRLELQARIADREPDMDDGGRCLWDEDR